MILLYTSNSYHVGEAVFVPTVTAGPGHSRCISQQIVPQRSYSPDIFEYVYFARAESIMDGISVNRMRRFTGEALARTIMKTRSAHGDKFSYDEIDCVIPVPDTSFVCALAAAQYMSKPLSFGLVKNRFASRTFTLPTQKERSKAVSRKLGTVQEEFEGRNVLIIDDSIVRGTTAVQIVAMARRAGAKKVYFASGSPAIRYYSSLLH
jgi:amidophosphoribosyltransferase